MSFSVAGNIRQSMDFDDFLQRVEAFYGREVSSISEMRQRDNKKLKGDVWEAFCKAYLIATGKYIVVWLWHELPDEVRIGFNLRLKVDNGIDIIAATETGYTAIQCKYRGKKTSLVPWGTLCTFVGLCALGDYEQHIVMTNCRGVTRRVPRTAKDKAICYGTFKGLKREMWLKLSGDYIEHRLTDASVGPVGPKEENAPATKEDESSMPSVDEVRRLRLLRFG